MNLIPFADLPEDTRQITVMLPGWQPQVSAYEILQYGDMYASYLTGFYSNMPDKPGAGPYERVEVQVKNNVGYVTISAGNLYGDTVVRYWPNGFTQPRLMLTNSN